MCDPEALPKFPTPLFVSTGSKVDEYTRKSCTWLSTLAVVPIPASKFGADRNCCYDQSTISKNTRRELIYRSSKFNELNFQSTGYKKRTTNKVVNTKKLINRSEGMKIAVKALLIVNGRRFWAIWLKSTFICIIG